MIRVRLDCGHTRWVPLWTWRDGFWSWWPRPRLLLCRHHRQYRTVLA